MSISDMIVVMKLGVVQQVGKPQEIYDDPQNLFVAKFLGTPPINVFKGYVKDEKLYIGGEVTPIVEQKEVETEKDGVIVTETIEETVGYNFEGGECVLNVKGVENQAVTVAVRPEGFVVDKKGALTCNLSNIEVMGRDVSIVSRHEASLNPAIRSIVNAESAQVSGETVSFNLKANKTFLFNAETEERIYFEV